MKKYIAVLLLTTISYLFGNLTFALTASQLRSESAKRSYVIGYTQGRNLSRLSKEFDIEFDPKVFKAAIEEGLTRKKPLVDNKEMNSIMIKLQEIIANKQKMNLELAKKENLVKSNEFLAKNKSKQGVNVADKGLQYEVLKRGNGARPSLNDTVIVNYVGKTIDGREFDKGTKFEFPLKNLIQGWQIALQMMPVGSKWHIVVPPKLAYGENGSPPVIKPNSALQFDIELVGIKKSS